MSGEDGVKRTAAFVILAAAMAGIGARASGEGSAELPRSVRNQLAKAYGLEKRDKPAEAIAAFQAVLKKDPGDRAVLAELGYLHLKLRKPRLAARYLKEAAARDPEDLRLRLDMAYALQAAKDPEAARVEFDAVASRPGELQAQARAALHALGEKTEARQLRLRQEGYDALRRGDKAAARRAFEATESLYPRDATTRKQLGYLDLEEGDVAAAAAEFEAVRGLDAGDYAAALQLGYIDQRLGKLDQAKEAFAAAAASPDERVRAAAETALKPAPAQAAAATPEEPAP